MVNYLYALKKNFSRRGIFFSFSGPLSQEVMVEIGSTLKQKMKLEEASKTTVIRVFSMVVENAQNIIYYSAEESHGIITVGSENEHYFVLSGNMVENEKVEGLNKKLTKLRTMNRDELKKYYKKKRKTGPDEGSKGGGLGFIEMARKASRPIEFSFKKINEKFSFFSVKIVI
ncbi:SiaB family protein kinase [Desulfobacterales bacterium HSG2]|nr:SiaB family protein kinase [Desulfobacterales bacterium HSG2]